MHPSCPFTAKQIERFCSRTVEQPNGCLIWSGCVVGEYGRVGLNSRLWLAHRVGYTIQKGPIPDGLIIRHRCPGGPRTLCCNGDHLLTGTNKENSEDMVADGHVNAPRGERVWNHVLTEEQAKQAKEWLIAGTMSQLAMAQVFRVSKSTINAIRLGSSWHWLDPQLPTQIPQPHRRFLDSDYIDIRDLWRDGWKLRDIASKYECRVDVVQAIISGKRGITDPLGERVIRKNRNKHSDQTRMLIYQRHLAGEKQITLASEFGLSKNGLCNLIAKMKQSP